MKLKFKPRHIGSKIYTLTTVFYYFYCIRGLFIIKAASIWDSSGSPVV